MNEAINKGHLLKFQQFILYIQQFKVLGNLEKKNTFPLTLMVTLPKKCQKKSYKVSIKIVALTRMHGIE